MAGARHAGWKATGRCSGWRRRWRRGRRPGSGDDLAPGERVRERAAVHVLELAAHRDAVRDARRADAAPRDQLADVVRGGIAFDGRVGREDHLLDLALFEQRLEAVEAELLRANAVERREVAHQHEVAAAIAAGLLDRDDVGRRLDDAQGGRVALRRRADLAQFAVRQHAAPAAVYDVRRRILE